ncbi:sigma-70 family RNA polymerase sigma factor [Arthrobacter sp. E3]|uniref:RNA polymerase sigma factor n=1 Tax=Arthrobacter sp. E3 TaxID=517402 RepID=UPI001A93A9BA|nr:sigma-70 family RNA polymerase sigma factor [Arthrobacter sp. E3]
MSTPRSLVDEAAELFREFQGGKRSQIEPLVRLLNPTLWHLARGCGLERADAEDVIQTTWLTLVKKAEGIRDPQAVLAWLGISVRREAWRVAGERRREAPRQDAEVLVQVQDTGPGPDETVLMDESQRQLWMHISRLTPRCQAILRVVSRGGPPDYAALSETLGIPVGSIGPTRGRCLAALRQALATDPTWSTL